MTPTFGWLKQRLEFPTKPPNLDQVVWGAKNCLKPQQDLETKNPTVKGTQFHEQPIWKDINNQENVLPSLTQNIQKPKLHGGFNPIWKIFNQIGSFSQVRVKTKKSNHQLGWAFFWFDLSCFFRWSWNIQQKQLEKTTKHTLRIFGPSKLAILRTLALLYRFKPFHWRVQDP